MQRDVTQVSTSHRQREGGGFIVRRPFPSRGLERVDPFLMLDEMGPVEYGPGEAVGAPDHPHRGFETVTYLLDGELAHADSAGHRGTLGPGDVQWMTAGRGVVHSELPTRALRDRGGRVHGFQLWVNLPARAKLIEPRYQELAAAAIPRARSADGRAEAVVIAGEALGVRAAIATHTPIVFQHWTLHPGAEVEVALPPDHAGFAYVFAGTAAVGTGARSVGDGQVAVLGDGDRLRLAHAGGDEAQLLLLGGVPIGEPVVQHGPFVMNTAAEIEQAIRDYQAGRLGRISPA